MRPPGVEPVRTPTNATSIPSAGFRMGPPFPDAYQEKEMHDVRGGVRRLPVRQAEKRRWRETGAGSGLGHGGLALQARSPGRQGANQGRAAGQLKPVNIFSEAHSGIEPGAVL